MMFLSEVKSQKGLCCEKKCEAESQALRVWMPPLQPQDRTCGPVCSLPASPTWNTNHVMCPWKNPQWSVRTFWGREFLSISSLIQSDNLNIRKYPLTCSFSDILCPWDQSLFHWHQIMPSEGFWPYNPLRWNLLIHRCLHIPARAPGSGYNQSMSTILHQS